MPPKPDEKSKLAREGSWVLKLPREYRGHLQRALGYAPFPVTMVDGMKLAIDLLEAHMKSVYGTRRKK